MENKEVMEVWERAYECSDKNITGNTLYDFITWVCCTKEGKKYINDCFKMQECKKV